jgi:hypothetical protein
MPADVQSRPPHESLPALPDVMAAGRRYAPVLPSESHSGTNRARHVPPQKMNEEAATVLRFPSCKVPLAAVLTQVAVRK